MTMRQIVLIDETIREGMQFQGVVFSLEQRIKMLSFQEQLGVDICQAGYPSAHPEEADMVRALAEHAATRRFRIRVAALGRAWMPDAKALVDTGIRDFHFHLHLPGNITDQTLEQAAEALAAVVGHVRKQRPDAVISLAMLDLGKTDPAVLGQWIRTLAQTAKIDLLSLPDTSGIMAPNQVAHRIRQAATMAGEKVISIHCHNDLGMAAANSIMGIVAGGGALEVSVLGIGERNGIGDLYTTVRLLSDQGFRFRFDHGNMDLITDYYTFVNDIVRQQTGQGLISPTTPVFGDGVHTHVAGTHAGKNFGTSTTPQFHLNLLCGKGLVRKYLIQHGIDFPPDRLDVITAAVKEWSIRNALRLEKSDIQDIVRSFE